MINYRFTVKSQNTSEFLGSGSFKVIKEMERKELLDFFHLYSNNIYLDKYKNVDIDINKQ